MRTVIFIVVGLVLAALLVRLIPATHRTLAASVRQLLADADDICQLFRANQHKVAGRLTVDVPSRIARRLIAPALPGLLRRYPKLQLTLGSTDRSIDLVQEGVDCAVRVGSLHDSSLAVRPLGHIALPMPVSMLYPHRRQRSRRLGVFVEWFEDLIRSHLET